MRGLPRVVLSVLLLLPAPACADPAVAEVSNLKLYSNFWLNLHHFLYASAWSHRTMAPGRRSLAMSMPATPSVSLTTDERSTWDAGVAYYDHELASNDLLFSPKMTAIKLALAEAADDLSSVSLDPRLRDVLKACAPIYRRHSWPDHDAANRRWIAEASRRTRTVSATIIARLTRLYRADWFKGSVRVDVVRFGKSQGAYTSIDPHPHITVASADADYDGWAATEMLFHESSHGLIEKVAAEIDNACEKANKNSRDLWHVVLFFIAGEVTRQVLADQGIEYRPYLYATGLFDRAWPQFRGPVEQHVSAYIRGETTLSQMAADLAAAVP